MEVQEILKFADDMVWLQTGKHLDDLQEAILRGTCQGQKYSEIATNYNCSEPHVKKAASVLWRVLSEKSGEDINKSNLQSTFKRLKISYFSNFGRDFVQIGSLNVCGNSGNSTQPQGKLRNKQEDPQLIRKVDRIDAPDVTIECDRLSELATLKNWILEERIRLVAILGISGMGKTAIALHLLSEIEDNFDFVIWRSLRTSPPPKAILKYLTEFLPPPKGQGEQKQPASGSCSQLGEQLSLLMERLRQYRCSIVFDDVQMVLGSEQIVGGYRPGCESYGLFFKTIGELSHNSCLIINSWTAPLEIVELTNNQAPTRCLELPGLGQAANKIFREAGLVDEDKWPELIEIYGGNPCWLKTVANTIQDFFCGRVGEYLQHDSIFLCAEITTRLDRLFQELSAIEQQAIAILAKEVQPVSMSQLLGNRDRPPSDLLSAIQSLEKRSLIQKVKRQNKVFFTVLPAIKEYLVVKWS